MAANLTLVAINSRKAIRFGIYFLIFMICANITWGILKRVVPIIFPPAPPPPTVGFSRLTSIPFPPATQAFPQFEFKIETANGALPEFPESMPVYFIPKPAATLDSIDAAKKRAVSLGFSPNPTPISQTIYKFISPTTPASLEVNVINQTFSTSFNLAADPSPLKFPPPTPDLANGVAVAYLKNAESLPEDLTVFGEPDFLKVEGQNLVKAVSLSESNFVRVNLFRKGFGEEEEYPSLTAHTGEANVWLIVSGDKERQKQIIASEFHYFDIDEEQVETYPIKTASQAVEDLLNGNAHIANLGLNTNGKITIRKIYLAYYDPDTTTQFFQPIVVFTGDRDFVAYVPAVTTEYYGDE